MTVRKVIYSAGELKRLLKALHEEGYCWRSKQSLISWQPDSFSLPCDFYFQEEGKIVYYNSGHIDGKEKENYGF